MLAGKAVTPSRTGVTVLPEAELLLWQRWREAADAGARAQLLDMHLPYARVMAATYYARRYDNSVEFAEYLQLASLGMLEAFERFQPDVGVQFRSFAARRMHGSILDGLLVSTEKHQQISARQRLLAQRQKDLKAVPDEATQGERPADQLLQYLAEVGIAYALAWILDGTGMVDRSDAVEVTPFYHQAQMKMLRHRLLDSVGALPPQERTVIQRHYLQEISFEDLAEHLGVTRGRVSQIHRKALGRLKDWLADEAYLK